MVRNLQSTRNTDAKGRVNLGEHFANRTVIVEDRGEGEVLVRLARVIPEREAWLYENDKALSSVRKGLKQAKGRRFAASKSSPDLNAAKKIAEQLEGE